MEEGVGFDLVLDQDEGGVKGGALFKDKLAADSAFFAGAAADEALDGLEGVAESSFMGGFVAQDELILLVENGQALFGDGGFAERDFGIEEGGGGQARHAVCFDERRQQRFDGGAVGIEFGLPTGTDGVHFLLRFARKKFSGIGAEAVLG